VVKQVFAGKSIQIDRNAYSPECKSYWFEGFIAQSQGDLKLRNSNWRVALQCSPTFIGFLFVIIPEDKVMAEFAATTQPEASEAWFWMAQLDDERAIEFYERGLTLEPTAGRRWMEYGNLIVAEDPERAMQAYLQSCINGDPGYNGCWLAGKTAEEIGEIEKAIKYYRHSLWSGALNRADELERKLNSAQEW
jgi:tetratricopeptide (TPR) repeat protein